MGADLLVLAGLISLLKAMYILPGYHSYHQMLSMWPMHFSAIQNCCWKTLIGSELIKPVYYSVEWVYDFLLSKVILKAIYVDIYKYICKECKI